MWKRPALRQPSPWRSHATNKSSQGITCRRNDISAESSSCDLICILTRIHCLDYFKRLLYFLLEVHPSRLLKIEDILSLTNLPEISLIHRIPFCKFFFFFFFFFFFLSFFRIPQFEQVRGSLRR